MPHTTHKALALSLSFLALLCASTSGACDYAQRKAIWNTEDTAQASSLDSCHNYASRAEQYTAEAARSCQNMDDYYTRSTLRNLSDAQRTRDLGTCRYFGREALSDLKQAIP